MPAQKRSIAEVHGAGAQSEHQQLLHRIRNMWQFANLSQWIYMFGKAAKIDDAIEIEELEAECLKPNSTVLTDIALAILKLSSSHRGLTSDIFDDQARKMFIARLPEHNPFGDDDDTHNFNDFDIFTKIRVLQQLTAWTMVHPERIREKMEEQRDVDQTSWRIEPYGWDSEDRTYFVLDDNRVYRLTEAPPPPPPAPKPKKRKRMSKGRRSSARRRSAIHEEEEEEANQDEAEQAHSEPEQDDGLGGMIWECIAVSLDDVRHFLDGLKKTRDANEKILRQQLEDHLVPILERQEESRKRKELQRERELLNLAKMANAKRSSRIADKAEQKKQEEIEKEEARVARDAELARAKEEQKRLKREKERDNRMFSRDKRVKEREARRKQHQEELDNLSQDNSDTGNERMSERRIQAEIEKRKLALRELEEEEEDWVFDCICGMYGHVDDGAHSVACEKCNVWQHSKCLGIDEEEADRPDFEFVCSSCVRREKEANATPKQTIKIILNRPNSSDGQAARINTQSIDIKKSADIVQEASSAPVEQPSITASTEQLTPPISQALSNTDVSPQKDLISTPANVPVPAVNPHHYVALPEPVNGGLMQSKPASSGDSSFLPPAENASQANGHTSSHLNGIIPSSSPERPTQLPKPSVTETPSGINSSPVRPTSARAEPRPVASVDSLGSSPFRSPGMVHEGYRASPAQSDVLPSTAGLSPIKQSPQTSGAFAAVKVGIPPVLPPVAALHPSAQQPILTPPVKQTTSFSSNQSQSSSP